MNILEALFVNCIFILFPLFCYFLFAISERDMEERVSSVLFDFALYSSLYLLLKFDTPFIGIKIMFMTIPLLIAYLKSNTFTVILLSISIGFYYYYPLGINVYYIIIEFIFYFIFIYLLKKWNESDVTIISVFVIIKIAFITLQLWGLLSNKTELITEIIVLPLAFYFITLLICYLLTRSEQIMNLHMTIKELEKQKQLRDSLFKITHEIKNPIAVCKGYLDMFDLDDKDHVKRYIPIIKQEIERTLTLMNDFLSLTKLNIDKRRIDISVLLQDVCEMASLMAKNKNVSLTYSIIDEELYMEADYDRLKQVLINLIKNAIEAIPNDGEGIIKINTNNDGKKLIITINDNGIGMSKEMLSKIGEAFYTTKQGGTGLGVRFSKEIITEHHGHIDYKSKLGVGTTATISLPIKKSF